MSTTQNPAKDTDTAATIDAGEECAGKGKSTTPAGEASVTVGTDSPGVRLQDERLDNTFKGIDLECYNRIGILSTHDEISLTNRRIATKRNVKLCGLSIMNTEESFLYQDLQHISVKSEHRFGFLVGSLLGLYAQSGLLLEAGAFYVFLAVVVIILSILALLYFLRGLCDRGALSLDFHRKGVADRWYWLSNPILRAKNGSSLTKTVHLNRNDRATVTRMLYEHPLSNFAMSDFHPGESSQKASNVEIDPLPSQEDKDTKEDDGPQLMSGERIERAFGGVEISGKCDAGLGITELASMEDRIYLTNKRIFIRKKRSLCGVPIFSSEASFLFQDLQHISVKMERKSRFAVTGLGCLVVGIIWNALTFSDAGTALSVTLMIVGILLLFSIFQIFVAKPMLHLDFYKKATVNQWLFGLDAISVLKEGSAVTETVHLNTDDLVSITRMLYAHPLAQYVEDRER